MTNETLWVNFKHCAYESCFISRIAKIWNLFILYCGCSFKSNCGNVGLIALQRFYHLTELVIYKSHSWDILRNDLASKWHMLCKVFPKKCPKGITVLSQMIQLLIKLNVSLCILGWIVCMLDLRLTPNHLPEYVVGVTWMNLDSKLGVKMHITKKQI